MENKCNFRNCKELKSVELSSIENIYDNDIFNKIYDIVSTIPQSNISESRDLPTLLTIFKSFTNSISKNGKLMFNDKFFDNLLKQIAKNDFQESLFYQCSSDLQFVIQNNLPIIDRNAEFVYNNSWVPLNPQLFQEQEDSLGSIMFNNLFSSLENIEILSVDFINMILPKIFSAIPEAGNLKASQQACENTQNLLLKIGLSTKFQNENTQKLIFDILLKLSNSLDSVQFLYSIIYLSLIKKQNFDLSNDLFLKFKHHIPIYDFQLQTPKSIQRLFLVNETIYALLENLSIIEIHSDKYTLITRIPTSIRYQFTTLTHDHLFFLEYQNALNVHYTKMTQNDLNNAVFQLNENINELLCVWSDINVYCLFSTRNANSSILIELSLNGDKLNFKQYPEFETPLLADYGFHISQTKFIIFSKLSKKGYIYQISSEKIEFKLNCNSIYPKQDIPFAGNSQMVVFYYPNSSKFKITRVECPFLLSIESTDELFNNLQYLTNQCLLQNLDDCSDLFYFFTSNPINNLNLLIKIGKICSDELLEICLMSIYLNLLSFKTSEILTSHISLLMNELKNFLTELILSPHQKSITKLLLIIFVNHYSIIFYPNYEQISKLFKQIFDEIKIDDELLLLFFSTPIIVYIANDKLFNLVTNINIPYLADNFIFRLNTMLQIEISKLNSLQILNYDSLIFGFLTSYFNYIFSQDDKRTIFMHLFIFTVRISHLDGCLQLKSKYLELLQTKLSALLTYFNSIPEFQTSIKQFDGIMPHKYAKKIETIKYETPHPLPHKYEYKSRISLPNSDEIVFRFDPKCSIDPKSSEILLSYLGKEGKVCKVFFPQNCIANDFPRSIRIPANDCLLIIRSQSVYEFYGIKLTAYSEIYSDKIEFKPSFAHFSFVFFSYLVGNLIKDCLNSFDVSEEEKLCFPFTRENLLSSDSNCLNKYQSGMAPKLDNSSNKTSSFQPNSTIDKSPSPNLNIDNSSKLNSSPLDKSLSSNSKINKTVASDSNSSQDNNVPSTSKSSKSPLSLPVIQSKKSNSFKLSRTNSTSFESNEPKRLPIRYGAIDLSKPDSSYSKSLHKSFIDSLQYEYQSNKITIAFLTFMYNQIPFKYHFKEDLRIHQVEKVVIATLLYHYNCIDDAIHIGVNTITTPNNKAKTTQISTNNQTNLNRQNNDIHNIIPTNPNNEQNAIETNKNINKANLNSENDQNIEITQSSKTQNASYSVEISQNLRIVWKSLYSMRLFIYQLRQKNPENFDTELHEIEEKARYLLTRTPSPNLNLILSFLQSKLKLSTIKDTQSIRNGRIEMRAKAMSLLNDLLEFHKELPISSKICIALENSFHHFSNDLLASIDFDLIQLYKLNFSKLTKFILLNIICDCNLEFRKSLLKLLKFHFYLNLDQNDLNEILNKYLEFQVNHPKDELHDAIWAIISILSFNLPKENMMFNSKTNSTLFNNSSINKTDYKPWNKNQHTNNQQNDQVNNMNKSKNDQTDAKECNINQASDNSKDIQRNMDKSKDNQSHHNLLHSNPTDNSKAVPFNNLFSNKTIQNSSNNSSALFEVFNKYLHLFNDQDLCLFLSIQSILVQTKQIQIFDLSELLNLFNKSSPCANSSIANLICVSLITYDYQIDINSFFIQLLTFIGNTYSNLSLDIKIPKISQFWLASEFISLIRMCCKSFSVVKDKLYDLFDSILDIQSDLHQRILLIAVFLVLGNDFCSLQTTDQSIVFDKINPQYFINSNQYTKSTIRGFSLNDFSYKIVESIPISRISIDPEFFLLTEKHCLLFKSLLNNKNYDLLSLTFHSALNVLLQNRNNLELFIKCVGFQLILTYSASLIHSKINSPIFKLTNFIDFFISQNAKEFSVLYGKGEIHKNMLISHSPNTTFVFNAEMHHNYFYELTGDSLDFISFGFLINQDKQCLKYLLDKPCSVLILSPNSYFMNYEKNTSVACGFIDNYLYFFLDRKYIKHGPIYFDCVKPYVEFKCDYSNSCKYSMNNTDHYRQLIKACKQISLNENVINQTSVSSFSISSASDSLSPVVISDRYTNPSLEHLFISHQRWQNQSNRMINRLLRNNSMFGEEEEEEEAIDINHRIIPHRISSRTSNRSYASTNSINFDHATNSNIFHVNSPTNLLNDNVETAHSFNLIHDTANSFNFNENSTNFGQNINFNTLNSIHSENAHSINFTDNLNSNNYGINDESDSYSYMSDTANANGINFDSMTDIGSNIGGTTNTPVSESNVYLNSRRVSKSTLENPLIEDIFIGQKLRVNKSQGIIYVDKMNDYWTQMHEKFNQKVGIVVAIEQQDNSLKMIKDNSIKAITTDLSTQNQEANPINHSIHTNSHFMNRNTSNSTDDSNIDNENSNAIHQNNENSNNSINTQINENSINQNQINEDSIDDETESDNSMAIIAVMKFFDQELGMDVYLRYDSRFLVPVTTNPFESMKQRQYSINDLYETLSIRISRLTSLFIIQNFIQKNEITIFNEYQFLFSSYIRELIEFEITTKPFLDKHFEINKIYKVNEIQHTIIQDQSKYSAMFNEILKYMMNIEEFVKLMFESHLTKIPEFTLNDFLSNSNTIFESTHPQTPLLISKQIEHKHLSGYILFVSPETDSGDFSFVVESPKFYLSFKKFDKSINYSGLIVDNRITIKHHIKYQTSNYGIHLMFYPLQKFHHDCLIDSPSCYLHLLFTLIRFSFSSNQKNFLGKFYSKTFLPLIFDNLANLLISNVYFSLIENIFSLMKFDLSFELIDKFDRFCNLFKFDPSEPINICIQQILLTKIMLKNASVKLIKDKILLDIPSVNSILINPSNIDGSIIKRSITRIFDSFANIYTKRNDFDEILSMLELCFSLADNNQFLPSVLIKDFLDLYSTNLVFESNHPLNQIETIIEVKCENSQEVKITFDQMTDLPNGTEILALNPISKNIIAKLKINSETKIVKSHFIIKIKLPNHQSTQHFSNEQSFNPQLTSQNEVISSESKEVNKNADDNQGKISNERFVNQNDVKTLWGFKFYVTTTCFTEIGKKELFVNHRLDFFKQIDIFESKWNYANDKILLNTTKHQLEAIDKNSITLRSTLLKRLNRKIFKLFSYCDVFCYNSPFSQLLISSRSSISFTQKEQQFSSWLLKPNYLPRLEVSFNRSKAALKASDPYNPDGKSLLEQMISQIPIDMLPNLRQSETPWRVKLLGEGATDAGGPGRDIFTQICIEVQQPYMNLFYQLKNGYLVPNNFLTNNKEMFVYVGALIGASYVTKLPQPFRFMPLVWKYLVNKKIEKEDIYLFDGEFKNLMNSIRSIDSEIEFPQINFTVLNSQGISIELFSNSSEIPVTFENKDVYCDLCEYYRINEFNQALELISEGVDIFIPESLRKMLTPKELEILVCGDLSISVSELKKHCKFDSNDQHVQMLWTVLERFTTEERMLFIKFATGRMGLPPPGMKWSSPLSIRFDMFIDKNKADERLPTASTCSSSISIPFYSSIDIMEKRIRAAITFGCDIERDHEMALDELVSIT